MSEVRKKPNGNDGNSDTQLLWCNFTSFLHNGSVVKVSIKYFPSTRDRMIALRDALTTWDLIGEEPKLSNWKDNSIMLRFTGDNHQEAHVIVSVMKAYAILTAWRQTYQLPYLMLRNGKLAVMQGPNTLTSWDTGYPLPDSDSWVLAAAKALKATEMTPKTESPTRPDAG